jgi:hypothetical protein
MLLGTAIVFASQMAGAQISAAAKQPVITSIQPSDQEVAAGKKVCPAMYADYLAAERNFHPPRGFAQVGTEFGPKTALKDKRTSLLWLHLDLTKGMSYAQVKAQMSKVQLGTWRFAASQEIREMFAHFNHSSDGFLKNDRLAAKLQHELGGPVSFTANADNGFCRNSCVGLIDEKFDLGHALYGYIANDNFFGPSMDPKLQGSSRDDSGAPFAASYLVRKERGNRVWEALRRCFSWL